MLIRDITNKYHIFEIKIQHANAIKLKLTHY